MIRAVADTNVSISALVFGGVPLAFLKLATRGQIQLVSSVPLLEELEEKLRDKFQWPRERIEQVYLLFAAICDVVSTVETLTVVREDPDDDRVLECAVAGRADYIVTGDRHLLNLGSYVGIRIFTVRQFIDIFNSTV